MQTLPSHAVPLAAVTEVDGGLSVTWRDATRSFFHNVWLRDNCRCSECGDPVIGRRTLRLTDIELGCFPASAGIAPDGDLEIVWNDGHSTRFAGDWLREYRYDDAARAERAFKPPLWSQALRESPPTLAHAAVLEDPQAFMQLLEHVRESGFCFLNGAPAHTGTLEQLAAKIGPPQESNFGRVQDLIIDSSKRSIANSVEALKAHTDEPYRASPPGVVLFHCVDTDVDGAGESTFLDGFEIAETLRREDPEGFDALTAYPQAFRRFFAGDVDLIAEFPVISVDEFGNVTGVRVNDRVAAPLCIPPQRVPVYYRGLRVLLALADDPQRMIRRTLRRGDIAVFDNHRVLHGRTALTLTGRRWLQWMQVERGDFHSALRITADRQHIERDGAPLLRGAYG